MTQIPNETLKQPNPTPQTLAIQTRIGLRSHYPERQQEAADGLASLAELDPILAAPLIRKALETHEKLICRAACKALPSLTLALPDDGNALFISLFRGELGDPKSLEAVTELKHLAELSPKAAAPILQNALRITLNFSNTDSALGLPTLAEADPLVALPLIEEALSDPETSVQIQGAQALAPLAAGYPDLAKPLIDEALQSKDDMVLNPARKADRILNNQP
jgi:HEAT repeat protein